MWATHGCMGVPRLGQGPPPRFSCTPARFPADIQRSGRVASSRCVQFRGRTRRRRSAPPAGALATTTIAGRSSRPFSVQAGVQACITVPGGCASLSCSAMAWCRLGSNGLPVGSSRLMPLRSSTARKLRSTPSRPSRSLPTISGSVRLGRRQAVDAAAQVIRRLHYVGGELLHRVLPRFIDLAAGAGAHVGDLGLGAHPAILQLRHLRLEFGDAGGGGLHDRLLRERGILVGGVRRGGIRLHRGSRHRLPGAGCGCRAFFRVRCSWALS